MVSDEEAIQYGVLAVMWVFALANIRVGDMFAAGLRGGEITPVPSLLSTLTVLMTLSSWSSIAVGIWSCFVLTWYLSLGVFVVACIFALGLPTGNWIFALKHHPGVMLLGTPLIAITAGTYLAINFLSS